MAIAALISPYRSDRDAARAVAERRGVAFHEVHVAADLATCESRDPKGLYGRARRGELSGLTGVDAPYQAPPTPEFVIESGRLTVAESVDALLSYVGERFPSSALRYER